MSRRQTSEKPEPSSSRLRAALYARVSVSNGSDSIPAQLEHCRAYAATEGFGIVAEFSDDGISGAKGDDERDGLAAAIAAIEDGQAGVIIAHRADRYARALHVQEAVYAAVWRAGGRVFEAIGGEILEDDPDDPYRTAMRQMAGVFAQLERGLIRARMQGGRRRAQAAGRHIGGHRPYGYTIDADSGNLTPLQSEQVVIARIRALRCGGAGIREIGREVGLHPEQIRRILARNA
jgi:DNA invertase Pin-like site-specific DNA recombinase